MTEVVEVLINGRWPILVPEHRALREEWPWWEATRLAAMHHFLEPGDIVYDVGAEEGEFPALWASWGCEVAMLEPNPLAWPNIKLVWEMNEFEHLATFAGFAAAETRVPAGRVFTEFMGPRFGWPPEANGEVIAAHGFLNLYEEPERPRVKLDDFAMIVPPPTCITIDVEGSELKVLLGSQRILEEYRPKVFVSVHPEDMRTLYHSEPISLFQLMESLGYECTFLSKEHEEHWMCLPK